MFAPDGPTLFELLVQASVSTREGYDRLATRFDVTPFRTPTAIVDAALEAAAEAAPLGDVLDVCCGTGAAASRVVTPGRIVGVDFSPGMLAVARGAVPDATFFECDARTLPFVEEFDLAISFGAFGHFEVREQPALLDGVHRALRPGGRFVFVTSLRPRPWNPRALAYRTFNAVLRIRNRLWKPPFIMYYLNFLLPEARIRLERAGFTVEERPLVGLGPFPLARIVIATKNAS